MRNTGSGDLSPLVVGIPVVIGPRFAFPIDDPQRPDTCLAALRQAKPGAEFLWTGTVASSSWPYGVVSAAYGLDAVHGSILDWRSPSRLPGA